MRKLASLRNRFTFLRSVLLTIALPLSLAAQSAKVSGAVVDSAKAPLSGVRILIVGTTFSAVTDGSGRFSIGGVTAGAYDLRAQRIGYRPVTIPIVLHDGEEATVAVTLSAAPIQLAGIVVSASRRSEKITEAPATVTRITASEIENAAGNSFGPALKQVEGLDFIQTGVMSVA